MKSVHLCAALALACAVAIATPAIAQDGQVEVPYGAWISAAIEWAYAIVGVGVLWVLRRVPAHVLAMIDAIARALGQGSMNELLDKAVRYGINATQGAVADRTLTVRVGNEVLERAAEYALRHAPGLVAKYGGVATLREKIIARLTLDENAATPSPKPSADLLVAGAGNEGP